LLTEDAWHNGLTVTHCLQPLLTAGTVAAAVYLHKARWFAKPAFLGLAVLGSVLTAYGTMGRQASQIDSVENEASRQNRTLATIQGELSEAKQGQKAECVKIGPRCAQWNARVDALTAQASGIASVTVNPKADAVAKLANLVGADGGKTQAIVRAVDPVALPLFLELGSVVFMSAAFARTRKKIRETVGKDCESVAEIELSNVPEIRKVFSKGEALTDLRKLKEVGTQKFLAERYGVSEATVSKWLKDWQTNGEVARPRDGRKKQVLALPAPRRKA